MMRDLSAWPTVRAYLDWAIGQGFDVRIVDLASPGVTRYRCALIVDRASGRSTPEIFQEEGDHLMSTTVARLDRRLGRKSYFFT